MTPCSRPHGCCGTSPSGAARSRACSRTSRRPCPLPSCAWTIPTTASSTSWRAPRGTSPRGIPCPRWTACGSRSRTAGSCCAPPTRSRCSCSASRPAPRRRSRRTAPKSSDGSPSRAYECDARPPAVGVPARRWPAGRGPGGRPLAGARDDGARLGGHHPGRRHVSHDARPCAARAGPVPARGHRLGHGGPAVRLSRHRPRPTAAPRSATALVALLYLGIGSLRFRRGLPSASAHARAHLGVLLACLGLTLTWGALLDPVQAVAGLHGALTRRALATRLPAAPLIAVLGVAATVASLVWGVREKSTLLAGSWGALLGGSFVAFLVLPAMVAVGGSRNRSRQPLDGGLAADERRLEALAFGLDGEGPDSRAPPGFPSLEAAATTVPLWDGPRVLAVARRREYLGARATPAAAALLPHRLGSGRATWIVGPMPDLDSLAPTRPIPGWTEIHRGPWTHAGRPVAAVEGDTGLDFAPLVTRDSTIWFGPGFREFAVAAPDTWPALRGTGLPLTGGWRRAAPPRAPRSKRTEEHTS